jgi:uncharacterized protein
MRTKVRILSLDGGGIRGIIPATVLVYVEKKIQELTGDPDARIADYFEIVVGTSTGAILGCFICMPNAKDYPAERALKLYARHGREIFTEARRNSWFGLRQLFNATRFSPDNLERLFKENFGDVMFHDLRTHCIVTTYDIENCRAFFFNSREKKREDREKRDFFIREVVRSTSAAPTYFPPIRVKTRHKKMMNIDGGVFANNPAMCAYAEVRTTQYDFILDKEGNPRFPRVKDMMMLSLGTGALPMDLNNVDKSNRWGVIGWAKAAPEIMMDGAADTVHYQVDKVFGSIGKNAKKQFLRVDVPAELRKLTNESTKKDPRPYNSDMSDASPQNIKKLEFAGEVTVKSANTDHPDRLKLDEFIREIVKMGKRV